MEGELQVVVGRNLRRIRKESGRSQETFGHDIQWHRTFVGAVERGERNLTLKTIEFLSDQLGVHPLDLLWDQEGIGVVVSPEGRPRFVPRRRAQATPLALAADPMSKGRPPGDPSPVVKRPRPRPT
jgi:transcriptional regulator with XRE-family HTH domain